MGIEAHPSPTFCVTHTTLLMHILRRMHIFMNTFGQLDVSLSQIQQSPPHVQLMHIFGHMDVHCTKLPHILALPDDHLGVPSDVGTCAP